VKLTFRCDPAHEALLPKPAPARGGLPSWLKAMPAELWSETAGTDIRTVKQCPPFIDAMSMGVLMPLLADLTVSGGEFSWNSALPVVEGRDVIRSPLGVHVPEQARGAPFADPDQFILKFMNPWSIAAPEGWSIFFTHPVNRLDLPFRTLTGLVDCDAFGLGLVHFPALWIDKGFEGTLPKGTPVAQAIPVRRETLDLDIAALDPAAVAQQQALRQALQSEPGVYRKRFRQA
jgi:hypothetical protein